MTTAFHTYNDSLIAPDSNGYLTVEEVALRMGIPAGLVLRRVEAGDVPARRVERLDGTSTYVLKLADLGIEADALDSAGIDLIGDDTAVAGVVELVGTVEVSREELASTADDEVISASHPETDEIDIEVLVPPPSRRDRTDRQMALIDATSGPLADISGMSIDPRELVAGLLDRWERTLEQRIYAEQRQRFEAELVSRQSMVKELQMELRTVRAEHAAAQSEKERILAERERSIADTERELDSARRIASQAQIELQAQVQTQTRRRGWLFRR